MTERENQLGASEEEWIDRGFRLKALFSPATPIHRAELFSGRSDQIQRLIDAIFERGRHAVLFGERGVGKTSLANVFHEIIGGAGGSLLPIRKQASPVDTHTSLWRKVFRDITFEIKRELAYGREDVQELKLSDLYTDEIAPDDVVRELSRQSTGKRLVVIFDEFDKLENNETRKLISHTIKALSDVGSDATIVIVGVADDINILVGEHESVKRHIREIRMPRMSKDELNKILDERLSKVDMRLHGDARWKIVALSRGLPEYVHFLGRDAALYAATNRRRLISEEGVDYAIRNLLQQSDQSALHDYRTAIDSHRADNLYRQVLLACALTKTDEEGNFVPKDVVQPLASILGPGKRVKIATFQTHLTAFSSVDRGGILEKHGKPRAYKYRFREPKMQPYVIMQGIARGEVSDEAMSILDAPEEPRLSAEF